MTFNVQVFALQLACVYFGACLFQAIGCFLLRRFDEVVRLPGPTAVAVYGVWFVFVWLGFDRFNISVVGPDKPEFLRNVAFFFELMNAYNVMFAAFGLLLLPGLAWGSRQAAKANRQREP